MNCKLVDSTIQCRYATISDNFHRCLVNKLILQFRVVPLLFLATSIDVWSTLTTSWFCILCRAATISGNFHRCLINKLLLHFLCRSATISGNFHQCLVNKLILRFMSFRYYFCPTSVVVWSTSWFYILRRSATISRVFSDVNLVDINTWGRSLCFREKSRQCARREEENGT